MLIHLYRVMKYKIKHFNFELKSYTAFFKSVLIANKINFIMAIIKIIRSITLGYLLICIPYFVTAQGNHVETIRITGNRTQLFKGKYTPLNYLNL